MVAAACLALAIWFGAVELWMHYDATRPSKPDESTGRIYAQNTHEHYVYLNLQEWRSVRGLSLLAGALFVGAVGIDVFVVRRGQAS